jgi:hypothetical protein
MSKSTNAATNSLQKLEVVTTKFHRTRTPLVTQEATVPHLDIEESVGDDVSQEPRLHGVAQVTTGPGCSSHKQCHHYRCEQERGNGTVTKVNTFIRVTQVNTYMTGRVVPPTSSVTTNAERWDRCDGQSCVTGIDVLDKSWEGSTSFGKIGTWARSSSYICRVKKLGTMARNMEIVDG